MTKNIIEKIENKADNANKFIKDNCVTIVETIFPLFEARENMKDKEFSEFCLSGQWSFLYDKKSEKTGKYVMGQSSKNILSGLKAIYEDSAIFADWCESEHGNKITSFSKMKMALSAFSASKNKTETQLGWKPEAETPETPETPEKNDKRTQAQLLENFLQVWKSAGYGDSIAFMEYLETKEAVSIADKHIEAA